MSDNDDYRKEQQKKLEDFLRNFQLIQKMGFERESERLKHRHKIAGINFVCFYLLFQYFMYAINHYSYCDTGLFFEIIPTILFVLILSNSAYIYVKNLIK